MKKTEIAKLVQIERHRQFARFRARELAAVEAVNTGIHGKLITPLEKPTNEKLIEAFTGGESANYWDPFFSKRLTLDESAGLLMALDTSQVKFAAHVVGRKIPEKNWPPFGIAADLVKAFTDMRGDIADWRKTSDDKYRAGDLIAWAKEKDFVADEVLEAWEAYKKAEAGEAKQVTAPATPDAVQPEPHTPRVKRHTTKDKRRDTLTPVIETAQKQCNEPKDTAEVWATLQVLAEKKVAPLIGATEQGLQYLKNGTCEIFNRDALRKRLGR